ncbi:MAG: hypothetical protein ACHQIK_09990 [Candidatus Acidiferrales bacterium]
MDARAWEWLVGLVGGIASIVSVLLVLVSPSHQRKVAALATVAVTVLAVVLALTHHTESISDVKVYAEAGTYQVADFLEFLSRGSFRVTMDSKTAEDLHQRQIKIKVPNLKDASLQYVLDQVLTPQLPGPEQWTYEVVGKTVMVKRR